MERKTGVIFGAVHTPLRGTFSQVKDAIFGTGKLKRLSGASPRYPHDSGFSFSRYLQFDSLVEFAQ
jgi:hypothetical protein